MKRIISIILLVLILFNSNGYFLFFNYLQQNLQQEIKREIRKGLNQKDLTLIVISAKNQKEICWIKKGREFKYQDLMYDVVSFREKGNKMYYYCINDVKEKNLIAFYTSHNRRRNRVLLKLRKVLSQKYFPIFFSLNINVNKVDVFSKEYIENYIAIYIETLSPPPKV